MKRESTGVSCFRISSGKEPMKKNPIQTSKATVDEMATSFASIGSP